MRFAASPLLVAVALGLLGPAALEAEDDELEDHASGSAVTSTLTSPLSSVVTSLLTSDGAPADSSAAGASIRAS